MKSKKNRLEKIMKELELVKEMLKSFSMETTAVKIDLKDEVWTVNQVAIYLHKTKGTIQSHYQGKAGFPRSKKIGNRHYWKPLEVIAYAQKMSIH